MEIHERLRHARELRGFPSAAEAARAIGVPYGTYSGHENGSRGITRENVTEYAKKFRVSPHWMLTGDGTPRPQTVPIVGLAGANPDGSILYNEAQGEIGDAPMVPGGDERTVAVEVRGSSMRGIAEDGWLIYYNDRRDPPTDDLIGELCVVGLDSGEVLVKTLRRGTRKKLFNLESVTAAMREDVRVLWAAPVIAMVPRRQAQRLVVR